MVELSKPLAGIEPCTFTAAGLSPASTCQEATSVSPFQLAYTAVESPVVRILALTAGAVSGWPTQGKRKTR